MDGRAAARRSCFRSKRSRVRTKNTVYEITVMDAAVGDVLVRGGRFFPVYTRVRLAGASLAGSFLKLLGIYVGFSMELHTDERRL